MAEIFVAWPFCRGTPFGGGRSAAAWHEKLAGPVAATVAFAVG